MRTAVVTGASTGIGAATAKVLANAGFRVFGSVRRPADGQRLIDTIGSSFIPLTFDVADADAVAEGARVVAASLGGATLTGLVNNAGIAVLGPLLHLPPAELRRQLDINLIGQLTVTQAFAPMLGADLTRTGAPGRIVMMSSVGGRTGSPFMGAYNASKFALEGLSESLRRELTLFGIDVVIVAPGAIATPIWDKAESQDLNQFKDSPYGPAIGRAKLAIAAGRLGFPPERVGEVVLEALTVPTPKVRYTITPTPWVQRFVDLMPRRLLDRIVAKRLGLRRT